MNIQFTRTDFKYCPFCASELEHIIQTDANSDKRCPVCKGFTVIGKKWAGHSVQELPYTIYTQPIQCDYCGLPMIAGYDRNGKHYCYGCKHNGA